MRQSLHKCDPEIKLNLPNTTLSKFHAAKQEKRIGEQVWRALYDPLDSRNVFLALIVPDNKQNGVAPKVKP